MLIVTLVIALPVLALVLAALVHDVREDGYGHRAARRSAGAAGDQVHPVGAPTPGAPYRPVVVR